MQAYQQQAAHQQEAESEAGAVVSPPSPLLGLLEDTAGSSGTADECLEAAMHSLDIQQVYKILLLAIYVQRLCVAPWSMMTFTTVFITCLYISHFATTTTPSILVLSIWILCHFTAHTCVAVLYPLSALPYKPIACERIAIYTH
jgi:hypothetical protein